MALWGFSRESTQVATGSNTVAGIVKGYRPLPQVSGTNQPDGNNGNIQVANKRNVIATSMGWVRRVNKTDVHGNVRQFDETLIAASPGYGFNYNANTYLGNPDIVEIYVKTNANNVTGVLAAANTVNALVLAGIKQMAVGATALPATFTPATISVARTIPKVYLAFHPAGA